jgi:SAM-dependent methyltransferase
MTDYATAWNKWFPVIEGGARDLSLCMLNSAGIAPGHRVLDLATGIGEPALSAAQQVGPDGFVLGVDNSTKMLTFARDRAKQLDLHNVEFKVMDADNLDIPSGEFDVVLCRWGVMFFNDLGTTMAQLRSALKPGGYLSIAVWASADEVPSLSLAARIVHHKLGLQPPNEGAHTAFAHGDTSDLLMALESAGYSEVNQQRVSVNYEFDSPLDYVNYRQDVSTTLNRGLSGHRKIEQSRAWQAVEYAVEAYRSPAGTIRMENWAYNVSARRD